MTSFDSAQASIAPATTTYGLAIHTSSPDLGFAISNFAGDRRQQVWNLGREVSNHLHQYLTEFLAPQTWSDLAFLAVATGPGGFTGTRIGVVMARTLAQQLAIPLFGVSSLAAISGAYAAEAIAVTSPIVAVQMPAQRGELYTAIYQVSGANLTPLLPDAVMSPDAWQKVLATWETPYQLIEAEANQGARVGSVLEIAYQRWRSGHSTNWADVLPFYGQHPVHQS